MRLQWASAKAAIEEIDWRQKLTWFKNLPPPGSVARPADQILRKMTYHPNDTPVRQCSLIYRVRLKSIETFPPQRLQRAENIPWTFPFQSQPERNR